MEVPPSTLYSPFMATKDRSQVSSTGALVTTRCLLVWGPGSPQPVHICVNLYGLLNPQSPVPSE